MIVVRVSFSRSRWPESEQRAAHETTDLCYNIIVIINRKVSTCLRRVCACACFCMYIQHSVCSFFGSVIHCICYSIYSKNGFMLLLVFEWTKKSVCIAIFQMETYDAEEHTNFQHKDKQNECLRERERRDGWRGTVWCYAVISILCILWWYFFRCFFYCLWHSAIACLFFALCVFQIQHQPQEEWFYLLLVDWASSLEYAPTNKQPQPIHFFCSFFRRTSHLIHFQFFSALHAFVCFVFHFVFSTFALWRRWRWTSLARYSFFTGFRSLFFISSTLQADRLRTYTGFTLCMLGMRRKNEIVKLMAESRITFDAKRGILLAIRNVFGFISFHLVFSLSTSSSSYSHSTQL